MQKPDRQSNAELTYYWTEVQFELSAFVATLVPDYHDAHDIVQRTAMAVVKKFDQYDRERSFRDWAIGIARLEILKYRKAKAREKRIFDQLLIDQITTAYRRSDLKLDEIYQALQMCMRRVQGSKRKVLIMWHVDQIEPERIAQWLGTTKNALYVQLHRIRVSLRRCIKRRMALAGEGS